MKTEVSIVIPNYNGRLLLEKNLPEVITACQNCEIIVIDDASTDESAAFLKVKYPQIKLVQHRQNQRFAVSCNSGAKAARGKVIIFLNTDVVPEKDFLKPLLSHFLNPLVFAVGCLEKDMVNGKTIYSGRAQARFEKGFLVHWRAKDQTDEDTYWAAGGSMAVDRKKYLELGGMDTLYRPAYYEDIDLSYRARKRGWLILFEPKSQVFHHHETTNASVFNRAEMKSYAYKNQFLFVWKNGGLFLRWQNILWLPFHLIQALVKKDWSFFRGFALALKQLPELIK